MQVVGHLRQVCQAILHAPACLAFEGADQSLIEPQLEVIAWPDPVDEGPVDLQGVLQDGLGALWVLADEVLGSIDGPQQRLQVGCTISWVLSGVVNVFCNGFISGLI